MEVSPAVTQRISTALKDFKNQMRTSNQRYISRLVEEANTVGAPQRMRNFAQSIKLGGNFPSQFHTPEEVLANPPPAAKWKIEHDGTWPPKLEAEAQNYVRRLTDKINEHFDQNDQEGEDVDVPEEYKALLKECDGVWDIDFRRSNVVGIHGTNCLGGGGTPFVGKNERFNKIDKSEERDSGWKIATGWCLDGNETVSHYYFYCQRALEGKGGPIQDKEREWGWRLFYRDLNSPEDVAFRVFHNIPEFLKWFGNWYARDIDGDVGSNVITPEFKIQDPPHEDGVNYEGPEDEEDAEAQEMLQFYLAEAARRGQ